MQQLSSSYGHKRTRFKTKASPTPLSIELRAPSLHGAERGELWKNFGLLSRKEGGGGRPWKPKVSTFSPHRAASPLKKSSPFHTPPRVKESAISPLSFTRGTPLPAKGRLGKNPSSLLTSKRGYRPTSKSAKKRLIRPVFPRLSAFLIHPFL